MRILNNIEELQDSQKTILTLGMFDGVHKGHQQIIAYLNQLAEEKNDQSCLLTFSPHPRLVLQKDSDLKMLTMQEEKIALLEKFGLDLLFVQPFDFAFSRNSSLEFVRDFLVNKLHVDILVIGHDHHFGRNREGNFDQLQELAELYNFEVIQLEAIIENEKPISSTKIRNALLDGDLAYANEALGYNYQIQGKVVHGDGIGKTLGFPTVNLSVPDLKLIPKDGVYGVEVELGNQSFFGLLNIGNRPTVDGTQHRVEVFILDFDGDLYDKMLTVKLLTRIRDEQKFENKEALVTQIRNDETAFRTFLGD